MKRDKRIREQVMEMPVRLFTGVKALSPRGYNVMQDRGQHLTVGEVYRRGRKDLRGWGKKSETEFREEVEREIQRRIAVADGEITSEIDNLQVEMFHEKMGQVKIPLRKVLDYIYREAEMDLFASEEKELIYENFNKALDKQKGLLEKALNQPEPKMEFSEKYYNYPEKVIATGAGTVNYIDQDGNQRVDTIGEILNSTNCSFQFKEWVSETHPSITSTMPDLKPSEDTKHTNTMMLGDEAGNSVKFEPKFKDPNDEERVGDLRMNLESLIGFPIHNLTITIEKGKPYLFKWAEKELQLRALKNEDFGMKPRSKGFHTDLTNEASMKFIADTVSKMSGCNVRYEGSDFYAGTDEFFHRFVVDGNNLLSVGVDKDIVEITVMLADYAQEVKAEKISQTIGFNEDDVVTTEALGEFYNTLQDLAMKYFRGRHKTQATLHLGKSLYRAYIPRRIQDRKGAVPVIRTPYGDLFVIQDDKFDLIEIGELVVEEQS